MGTSPKSSIFHSIYIYTYIVFKVLNRFNIYGYNCSIFFRFLFSILFPVLCPRFVSPLCLPVVSPRGVSPGRWSQCNESGWAFCANARALVENESEQFPVASAVPVAPQWGEQRGKTTGTTIGKHNGKKNRKQQRKVKKNVCIFLFIKLL